MRFVHRGGSPRACVVSVLDSAPNRNSDHLRSRVCVFVSAQDHYTEGEAHHLIATMAEAIFYCHENGVVHRDIKVLIPACVCACVRACVCVCAGL